MSSVVPLSDELRIVHQARCKQADPKQLAKNGTKYALCCTPFSETDQHFVDLSLSITRWSEVQAFLEWIGHKSQGTNRLFRTVDPEWSWPNKPRLSLERSGAPQSLCLHGVVLTTDNQLLAIQRPDKYHTDYYPDAWSISFEEQLSADDISPTTGQLSSEAWIRRAARQEVLGEAVGRCLNLDAVRLLAISLEEPIFNAFVVAIMPVSCNSRELGDLLPHAPDRDEWQRFTFLPLDTPFELINTIFTKNHMPDGGELHPTSRYRLYLALTVIRPVGGELLRRAWMQREA